MARKRGSHSDITGPKIRKVALGLIAQHGYAAVSMRRIAQDVGVQVGALYNYTPDKQSLLFDLMQSHLNSLLKELGKVDFSGDPAARLDAFVRFHIRFHLPKRDDVFVSYMELRNLSEENFNQIEVLRNSYEGTLATILNDGLNAGDFKIVDSKVTTLAIIAQLTGITNWYRADGRLSIEEVEAIYCDLVRRSVSN
jgi:AcrR family transcriptional regulator